MSQNKILNKKILFAAVLCLAYTTGIANAVEITNGKNVKIYDEVYENLNEQNIINYGSKWGY